MCDNKRQINEFDETIKAVVAGILLQQMRTKKSLIKH